MTSENKVYIAGVGSSPSAAQGSPTKAVIASLVSAATKALLDSGLTYDDVSYAVTSAKTKTSSDGSGAFRAFDEGGVTVDKVKIGSELDRSFDRVMKRASPCVLMVSIEESVIVALVLVSETFLRTHPYLKDSASLIRRAGATQSKPVAQQMSKGYHDVCQIVWALRGWSKSLDEAKKEDSVYYWRGSNQSFELSRADTKSIPEWKEVEHKQDGKHRLGYNPANETREISQEDLEAVRASGKSHNKSDDMAQFKRKGGDRAALAKL